MKKTRGCRKMCRNCNYSVMLEAIGLSATNNRLRVLEIIGTSSCPLTAQDVYSIFCRTEPINRVTIYRILELLVKKGLLDRLSGGRAAYYGMAPNEHHTAHPHFYCTMCGRLDCLAAERSGCESGTITTKFFRPN